MIKKFLESSISWSGWIRSYSTYLFQIVYNCIYIYIYICLRMNDSIQRQTTRWSMNSYDSIGRFRFLETVYVQDFLLSQFQHLPRLFSNVLIIYRNNRNIERKKIRKFDLFVYPGANLKNVHHIQLSFITFPYRWKKKKDIDSRYYNFSTPIFWKKWFNFEKTSKEWSRHFSFLGIVVEQWRARGTRAAHVQTSSSRGGRLGLFTWKAISVINVIFRSERPRKWLVDSRRVAHCYIR